jgi:hypothetical protein
MSFFNNKEEVLNIELTPYGKLLLSKGIFEPVYYAFFDDEIIYDNLYANFSESQNSIETRILEETIYNKPVYNTKGVETNLSNKLSKNIKSYEQENSIGTVDSVNQYSPAWEIKVLDGTTISGSSTSKSVYTGQSGSLKTVNIPQINLNTVNIKVNITNNNKPNINFDIINKNILLQIEELNVISEKENFDIEVYEVGPVDKNGNESLTQLHFIEKPIYIKDGIMLEEPILPNISPETDDTVVEYFFDINPDIEVKPDLLKKILNADKEINKNIKE